MTIKVKGKGKGQDNGPERFLSSFKRRRAAAERTLSAKTNSLGMTIKVKGKVKRFG